MGTNGLYGFRKNGIDKLTYSHYDSYPDGLGRKVIDFINTTDIKTINNIYDKIILVNENDKPTQEQIEKCKKYADLNVASRSLDDWYCLLNGCQGDLDVYKGDLEFMIDDLAFIANSTFCEYAYIINLDTNKLEYYEGYQKEFDENSRYNYLPRQYENYYPCKLIYEFSFDNLNKEKVIKVMDGEEDVKILDEDDAKGLKISNKYHEFLVFRDVYDNCQREFFNGFASDESDIKEIELLSKEDIKLFNQILEYEGMSKQRFLYFYNLLLKE